MIFFDVETTGLITNEALPLEMQPRIIEIAALKTDDDGNELETFSCRINPGVKLEAIITKITGLTDNDLTDAIKFPAVFNDLAGFFRGETTMLAHNARFDLMMLVFELQRIDAQWKFPFCSNIIDTKQFWERSLEKWAKSFFGEKFTQTHRALDDVMLLRDCYFNYLKRNHETQ
ncbi:DnaQ DNA polymerase III, epsilon subunit and related 3'-5' exonucleases [uncultured Caudovirales phage]|uniref:DnaQ DNA polymerase III, epsilon subunit and related 3'-5' exonucleases n=1 Tax=uncultured Caudovirales phage TaxID=2100421 RepID=A0A6J5RPS4_9CAUD|nr:DnaQ DNA polymerase III, epsilon subunit and related 3'-5' exonucleases [uncultured Caudovirales phage]CAB4176267.1 DnaQ DNA polymerase III, epsilon subunit and related 3'-5' exonucleases [uncultured Caudovirales phage]CAB4183008.1 DnaQ DNA polymerase III, epsilon subunit and related 3'-5' exonucleases [uncultured Caudovirales phage]CAB4198022.1 DnaQ DNA polymerase III, epsilon subunit and related 3'-5' exonucleases [uncultured Caudovirales phage]CAB4212417.1 DnaQ DNA polymerase III, epsilon